ncbi:MAG: MBL fold metallo-hydrolase [Actinomycetota bacterium]|nr:MBL fold metallo-hydrolase [Actinomycetota bacterium]
MNKLNDAIVNLKVEKNQIAFYFFGGSTIAIKNHEGTILYVDPCFSNSANEILSPLDYIKTDWKRLIEIPIEPEDVTADLVVCTHDHLDHYDVYTIPGIDKQSKPIFIGPSSCHYKLREQKIDEKRIVVLNPGNKKVVKGYEIEAFAADHTPDCIGFVLTYDGIRSCIIPEAKYSDTLKDRIISLKPVDLLFIGANEKYGAITPEEGAGIVCGLEPNIAIPVHYGLYAETHLDPQTFVDAVKETCGEKNIKTKILNFKETPFIYKK